MNTNKFVVDDHPNDRYHLLGFLRQKCGYDAEVLNTLYFSKR